jgi:hypothetical protein
MLREERYKPGYASLAMEVLKDGYKHGAKMDGTIWAEYLRRYVNRNKGRIKTVELLWEGLHDEA